MNMSKAVQRQLPVLLTRDEKLDFGRRLAELHHQFVTTEIEKKTTADQFKSKLESIDKRRDYLAGVLRDGEEVRAVECSWRYLFESNTKELIRLDSGEIVETAAITAEERQLLLDLAEPRLRAQGA